MSTKTIDLPKILGDDVDKYFFYDGLEESQTSLATDLMEALTRLREVVEQPVDLAQDRALLAGLLGISLDAVGDAELTQLTRVIRAGVNAPTLLGDMGKQITEQAVKSAERCRAVLYKHCPELEQVSWTIHAARDVGVYTITIEEK